MLRSKSTAQSNVELFRFFIQQTIDGNLSYRPMVLNILKETKNLALGEKTIYNINRENFPIIIFLNEKMSDFLINKNLDEIQQEDYRVILRNFMEYKEQPV